ncbi:competence type IV pilus major pilin ComGC [Schleiferilactobacillus harbinensis]|jgi:competence protein ComGC|uniref:competence type IV pilus major pilin ComGC n=1 Tax=Schleiferilactobacillus harbinensis TaxID=304207 RepID=UPI00123B631D|nr:competence type IV pilus major pilin ComGC [Schleiferilactobacillus harbinensis]QEU46930.1 prepilin-type N-terminal cleavage/methylation domain-containing protein [Schleiferilactobacillus harbinensis]
MMTLVKKQWMAKRKERKGFTLLEMLLVVFIIAALLLLVLPNLINQQDKVTAQTDQAFITTVQNQVTLYSSDNNGKKPQSFSDLEGKNGAVGYLSTEQLDKAKQKLILKDGIVSMQSSGTGDGKG